MGKAQANGVGTRIEHPTFETVWAALQETDRIVKEVGRKQEETARIIREVGRKQEETARQMKETDKKISNLGDRFGEMVEHMVMPGLVKKFRELGFVFTEANPRTGRHLFTSGMVALRKRKISLYNIGKTSLN